MAALMILSWLWIVIIEGAKGATLCCGDLGCFSDSPPWDHLSLPECATEYNPELRLYTRNNIYDYSLLTRTTTGSHFRPTSRTHILIHGWRSDGENEWIISMKNALLNHGNHNVIIVDWRHGADSFIDYWQDAGNTRTVAAEVATVFEKSLVPLGLTWPNVYCIGHSLGAHACGILGKMVSSLGRITGLDPAGPWWEDAVCEGRLCKTDAAFVDNIHTDGDCSWISVCYGLGMDIGHVDFYPNGGRDQPGCFRRKYIDSNGAEVYGDFGCSHGKAHAYFIESILGSCHFSATYCPNLEEQQAGRCEVCGSDCQSMGYHAEQRSGRGRHYLTTHSSPPYCKY